MTKYLSKKLTLLTVFFLISGCQSTKNIELSFKDGNYEKELVQGGDFLLTTYQKITDRNQPFVFYIEGDGKAFRNKYQVSENPTPQSSLTKDLAIADTRPNIVYVARPCQYTPMSLNPKCDKSYWTSKRLSQDSVDSINNVINKINNGQKFSLVGFSGGGGIAVLIAAENKDMVKDIITVSANLDHESFTNYHNVTPMRYSLNPINYTEQIKTIPQLHLSGDKDNIIPPFIAKNFVKKVNSKCAKHKVFHDVSHRKGWQEIWKKILNENLQCE